jgi:hypothetical protein
MAQGRREGRKKKKRGWWWGPHFLRGKIIFSHAFSWQVGGKAGGWVNKEAKFDSGQERKEQVF